MIVEIALGIVLGVVLLILLPYILLAAFWLLGIALLFTLIMAPLFLAETTGDNTWLVIYPVAGGFLFVPRLVGAIRRLIGWLRRK